MTSVGCVGCVVGCVGCVVGCVGCVVVGGVGDDITFLLLLLS